MAWLTRKCLAPLCRATAERGLSYCVTHANYKAERVKFLRERRPWDRWYNWAIWDKLRHMCLTRDPICQWVEHGVACTRPATDVDHVVAHKGNWDLFVGGVNLQNLQSLCHEHHAVKTAREDGAFGNRVKER